MLILQLMMTSYIVNIQHCFPSQARNFCSRTQCWERSAHTSCILNKQKKICNLTPLNILQPPYNQILHLLLSRIQTLLLLGIYFFPTSPSSGHSFSCLQSNLKNSSPVPGTQALWLSLYMDTLPSEGISLPKKEFLVSTLQMTKFILSSYTQNMGFRTLVVFIVPVWIFSHLFIKEQFKST